MEHSGVSWYGITPAYAGKSSLYHSPSIRARDHPRVCGEKDTAAYTPFRNVGSPPRMRGKVTPTGKPFGVVGITPAYAGKRETPSLGNLVNEDHPRVCGEKSAFGDSKDAMSRITPAYAGKSVAVVAR